MQTGEKIVPLNSSNQQEGSAADKIGNGIITVLKQAAQAARESADRAIRTSRRLEEQLQQSEARVKRLEAELKQSQGRAVCAEGWLSRVQKELEVAFAPSPVEEQVIVQRSSWTE